MRPYGEILVDFIRMTKRISCNCNQDSRYNEVWIKHELLLAFYLGNFQTINFERERNMKLEQLKRRRKFVNI